MKLSAFLPFIMLTALLTSCRPDAAIPAQSTPTDQQAAIYPDYRDIVVPPNIAPLNFQIKSEGRAFVAHIAGRRGGELLAAAESNGTFQLDSTAWRQLLQDNRGDSIIVTLYAERENGWVKHPSYGLLVAQEPIDAYLSYRLIEPSYELYRQLGLYQRNLTNFEEKPIYENNAEFDEQNNHCINCHNFQNYDTERMLFHVRASHGGTVFANDEKAERINMTNDSILGNAVYPSWHPTQPWVVFSSNYTGQAFHIQNPQKVEVLDYASDLIFYDVAQNKISNIIRSSAEMETFPAWSPDGKRVYYSSAPFPRFEQIPDSVKNDPKKHSDFILAQYKEVRYNLMSIPFDAATRTFGEPQVEFDCLSQGKSATLSRISPDGRYLLFTLADYGQFHIWHTSSDLYVKDLTTGEIRPLTRANSDNVDSYHAWSSNGRWFVFSSRRDDGSYTRTYIAYFDKEGREHKAFLLPQEDPEHNLSRMKSYNVPELTRNAVKISPNDFRKVVYDDANVKSTQYGK